MYNFFEIVSSDTVLNHRSQIISFCCNSKHKIFFYSNGDVQIYSDDWESTIFHINEDIKLCCIPEGCNIFIIFCQSLDTSKILFKIYSISKSARKAPSLLSNTEFANMSKVTTVNALKCLDTELCIAIGLDSGIVLLHKAPLSKEISPKSLKFLNVCSKPIKGIEFTQCSGEVHIFTCSDDGVFYYKLLSNTFFNETKVILDDIVSAVHCCTLQPITELNNERYFVVARDDGLYCYTKEGRGPCYALNGKKKIVEWFRKKYIIVLNIVDRWKMQDSDTFELVVIDIENKIIVLKKGTCNVVGIQSTYGLYNCLIFVKTGDVLTLKEKGVHYKIKHLVRKNMYEMALKLLEECNIDTDILANILVSYGDHLLQRGDMFGAVKMYSKTIGVVSPFVIVNKLSDFRYNECLIEYLTLLNATDFKSSEHFRLLKNCLQRIELPNKAFNIFTQVDNDCEKMLESCSAIERGDKILSILTALHRNSNMLTYLKMLSNEEVVNFFFEYGYFLLNQYPTEFKETVKYLLAENYSDRHNKIHKKLLPLLLLDKIFATNLIEDVCHHYKTKFSYNIWTELTLQMWQKGNVDIEFVINFFHLNREQICIDNAFIICRNYEFWPGIRLMYDKSGVQILSLRSLAKCFEMYPVYINEFSNEHNYHCNKMWTTSLRKDDILYNYSFKLVSEIFKRIIKTNPYYILNIVGDILNNSNISISHLNDFFLDEHIFQYFKKNEVSKEVSFLEEKVLNTKNILQKYTNQPIEFRSRSCAVCKQITKPSTLYFLCQHSFHKECIRQYSNSLECLVCSNKRNLGLKLNSHIQVQNFSYKSNNLEMQQNISKNIEKSILNINNSLHMRSLSENININIKFEDTKNGAENYDNNLNPFNI